MYVGQKLPLTQLSAMLHSLHTNKLSWVLSRTHIILHALAVFIFLYHRATHLLSSSTTTNAATFAALLLLFLAELTFFFLWLLDQAYRWRPVTRSVYVEKLSTELSGGGGGGDGNYEAKLPSIDVFICTADSEKEPTVEVMNTLISAMALDYPHNKLNVYLSDDGGAEVTLRAVREAWKFATWWIPFCKKYELECRCPEVYFGETEDEMQQLKISGKDSDEFMEERPQIKEKYDDFKKRVRDNMNNSRNEMQTKNTSRDHPPLIEVINENYPSPELKSINFNPDHVSSIPLLVYVAREKRPSHPHHFKAGALNTLLRVSGLLSNSPIVLVLDCDMYCNDPTSAKQAICFHSDPNISHNLAFVQFPQRFRNISKSDIYDSGLKSAFKLKWYGIDGLQGPILSGTGFYMKRIALYDSNKKGLDNVLELRSSFGTSYEFIKTLNDGEHRQASSNSQQLQKEALTVASCRFEKQTKWGDEVGFLYHSVLEDYFTGFTLHIKGWTSVYCDPPRAQFLGITVTDLNVSLIQRIRWSAGLIEVTLSRFCPLFYKLSSNMSILQRMCYASIGLSPLNCIPIWCYVTIPQLFLLHGIPLYPKVSSRIFPIMVLILTSCFLKNMYEVLVVMNGSFLYWFSQWRMWIINLLTSHAYGSLDVISKIFGMREVHFIPTNKFMDDKKVQTYERGMYDFQTSSIFLLPLGTTVMMNVACFGGGLTKLIRQGNLDEMLMQVLLSGFGLVISWPIIEGMVVRKDKGRFPFSDFVKCGVIITLILLGSFSVLS